MYRMRGCRMCKAKKAYICGDMCENPECVSHSVAPGLWLGWGGGGWG